MQGAPGAGQAEAGQGRGRAASWPGGARGEGAGVPRETQVNFDQKCGRGHPENGPPGPGLVGAPVQTRPHLKDFSYCWLIPSASTGLSRRVA